MTDITADNAAFAGGNGTQTTAEKAIDDNPAVVRRLILAAFTMLFVELALIRWLGANVVHLSYFSNFVLLGSFLGIGAGFLISRKSWSIWPFSLPLLAVLVIAVVKFPVTIEQSGSDIIYFSSLKVYGPPAWLALPLVFVTVLPSSPVQPSWSDVALPN
ncbi:hypothetical protein [Qipengyuania sp. 902]|uniref:hypothetical protein n=1 Tax=Qipengyuania sp. 902 TaxID=3417565 RepID=UPI003EC148DC